MHTHTHAHAHARTRARARTHTHTHMLPVDGGDRGEDTEAAGDLEGAWGMLLHHSLVCIECVRMRERGEGLGVSNRGGRREGERAREAKEERAGNKKREEREAESLLCVVCAKMPLRSCAFAPFVNARASAGRRDLCARTPCSTYVHAPGWSGPAPRRRTWSSTPAPLAPPARSPDRLCARARARACVRVRMHIRARTSVFCICKKRARTHACVRVCARERAF